MNVRTHTPGPWVWGRVDQDGYRKLLCAANEDHGDSVVTCIAGGPRTGDSVLIELAPELLKSVRDLLEDCAMYASDSNSCDCGTFEDTGICEHVTAHRLIAKVEGR